MTLRESPPLLERIAFACALAGKQVKYHVTLLLRSPMGIFTALIIPLMLLVVLNVAAPSTTFRELHGGRYADFLTPAMATFAILNACYVNVITSTVLAREAGILKRLHGTPLPLWAYIVGRMAAAAAVALTALVVIFGVGALFLDVQLNAGRIAEVAGVTALGAATFTTLGMAVSTLVSRPDTALPIAYGTLLPVAFVSNVFFPATTGPSWLTHVADLFPLAPIAKATERIFTTGTGHWPMSRGELTVTLAWIGATALVSAVAFRWQPGQSPLGRWNIFRR